VISLADVLAAAGRIEGGVRRTPMMRMAPVYSSGDVAAELTLKLECLQVTGSFKPRGALNVVRSLAPEVLARGVITASGGNHGLAVAYAGWAAGVGATIYLPRSVPAAKVAKLGRFGARVVIEGEVWDESNNAALAAAAREGLAYVHPFADPLVVAGQGTLATEIMADAPGTDTLVVAIGGGGLISGVAVAAKALKPGIRIVGVEPEGAPTLWESLRLGRPARLERIETAAGTLAPKSTDALNFRIIRELVAEVVLVSDDEMRAAAAWLWFEAGVAAELSGAAAVAALLTRRYAAMPGERVCAIVCGAGTDGMGVDG